MSLNCPTFVFIVIIVFFEKGFSFSDVRICSVVSNQSNFICKAAFIQISEAQRWNETSFNCKSEIKTLFFIFAITFKSRVKFNSYDKLNEAALNGIKDKKNRFKIKNQEFSFDQWWTRWRLMVFLMDFVPTTDVNMIFCLRSRRGAAAL